MSRKTSGIAVLVLSALMCGAAAAKLPAPTLEQQQAAAAKKEQAAAQSEKEKQELTETMDKIASRWRAKGHANGAKPQAPADAAASVPIRSEKLGTAAPSADVKQTSKKGPPDKIK